MTLKKFILSIVCLLSFVVSPSAQNATALASAAKTDDRLPPEVKEKAVNFLRTTAKDAATLNLPENRLAFLIATADLLWEYDETAARQAFKTAESDVRQMITAQMQKAALAEASESDFSVFDAFTSGDGSSTDVQSLINLRESLVLAIGKHDGETAYRFLIETRQPAPAAEDKEKPNNYMRQMMQLPTANDYRETALEMRLARVVAENDPQKALEIGLKRLSVGVSDELPAFAVRLYSKDKTRGSQLAQEINKKLKTSNFVSDDSARRVAITLFNNAAKSLTRGEKDKEIGKTPLLSESDVRDLANSLGRAAIVMTTQKDAAEDYELQQIRSVLLPQLEKYSPATAAQLKAKFNQNKTTVETKSYEDNEEFKKYLERQKKDQKAIEDLQKTVAASKGELTIEGARAALGLIKNRTAKLAALSQIVITFADNNKLEEAKELIADARKMIAPEPKFYAQYIEHLMVARALASVDPKQSLEMLENLIYRIDDLLSGVGKLAEFIVGETAVKENELRISGIPGFVGGNVFAQIGRGGGAGNIAGEFDKDLIKLAKADFERTTGLADKFSRPEIRMMARMILIGALLPQKDAENSLPDSIEPDIEAVPLATPVAITVKSSR